MVRRVMGDDREGGWMVMMRGSVMIGNDVEGISSDL
jgi:hypothetical protein